MSYTGWAVTLGDVTVTMGCDEHTPDVNCPTDNLTIEALDAPPDGLGLPGLRTEDVTYFQRDGVRHFNDWYSSRVITLVGSISETECEKCLTARQQLSALIQEWRRSCCDIELVIHTPCDGQFDVGEPILGPQLVRRNLIRNPSFEEDTQFWTVPADSFCRTYDRCYNPTWCYSNAIDGAFTESRPTNGGWVGDAYLRLTVDTPPTEPGIGFTYDPPSVAEPSVAAGLQYTASAYLRTSAPQEVVAQFLWFDSIGTLLGASAGDPVLVGTDWTRVTVTATAPENADYASVQWVTTTVDEWVIGSTIDIDGALMESGSDLMDYFDGDTPDVDDPPVVGNQVITNMWLANPNLSVSLQASQTYEENLDRSLYGPVGIVGRPRVATYQWLKHDQQIAEFTLRFDGTDQRMYVLDECGTPGYQTCVNVTPGLVQFCRTYPLCYDDTNGRCYSDDGNISLIVPVTGTLTGTERVNPLIVLYPGLSTPTVENMNTSEFVTFNGVVAGEPVQIDTENGIATGVDTGASYTHLLGGSIFLSMLPGENQFRMYSAASEDTGYASICYRPTVVSI